MNDIYYIYWIYADHHKNMATDGYIGVSKNPKKRFFQHKSKFLNGKSENPIFANAIKKYGWENLNKKILICGSSEYCYYMESILRSAKEIGWNYNIGGVKPPTTTYRGPDYVSPLKGKSRPAPWMIGAKHTLGKKASDETRAKMSATRKGVKQTPEQIAKRVASRKATLASQGRTV